MIGTGIIFYQTSYFGEQGLLDHLAVVFAVFAVAQAGSMMLTGVVLDRVAPHIVLSALQIVFICAVVLMLMLSTVPVILPYRETISLLMEHSGQPAPTLAGWLDDQTDCPILANAILAGRCVEGIITPDEWATMRGWVGDHLRGAFLYDPRNANAVRLMERIVARSHITTVRKLVRANAPGRPTPTTA